MERIYLDHSARTPMVAAAWDAMRPYMVDEPGNPASSHAFGRRARRALEDARERIAHLLGANPDEVIFTSGATEANNLALTGLVGPPPGAIVTSPIEHPCVLEPVRRLEERGYRLSLLPIARAGHVDLQRTRLPDDVRLASLMLVNHETGAIQPVAELAQLLPADVPLHCDAAAAAGKISLRFHDLGVRSLTISAHKFHGPPGVGALLVRRPASLRPLWHGGHQQRGKRPGSEPVALAVGMAAALSWCLTDLESKHGHVKALRGAFLDELQAAAAPLAVNSPDLAVPHVVSIAFLSCRADVMMMNLDLAGIACSAGSACSSGSLLPSPVLQAMGIEQELLKSSLRFSFSCRTSVDEVRRAARCICEISNKLRRVPLCDV